MPIMPWVLHRSVSFSELSLPPFCILYIWCLFQCLLCWMPYSPLGVQPLDFVPLQPLGAYPWQAYVQPGDGHWPTPGMHRVAAPSTTLSRGSLCYSITCSLAIPFIWWGTQLLGLSRESPNPSTFPAWWGGVCSSRCGSI